MRHPNRLVQSCINTVSYPDSISAFRAMVERRFDESGSVYKSLNTDEFYRSFDPDSGAAVPMCNDLFEQWTSPHWFTVGDVSFFYHAKRASRNSRIIYDQLSDILARSRSSKISLGDGGMPVSRKRLLDLIAIAKRGCEFASLYAGTIFAVARASGQFLKRTVGEDHHWKSPHYCDFDQMYFLQNPIQYESFKTVSPVSQQTITALTRTQFELIQELTLAENRYIKFLKTLIHRDTRISNIAKREGWRRVATDLAPVFLFEKQVREYLLDPFLIDLIGSRSKLATEVQSHNMGSRGFIDYVLAVDDQFIPVEAKCVALDTPELHAQLEKYCSSRILFRGNSVKTSSFCFLIDNERIWLFKSRKGFGNQGGLFEVAAFCNLSTKPIEKIRTLVFTEN